jgi:hypothetical protein
MADDRLAELRERLVESGILGQFDNQIDFDGNGRIEKYNEREKNKTEIKANTKVSIIDEKSKKRPREEDKHDRTK